MTAYHSKPTRVRIVGRERHVAMLCCLLLVTVLSMAALTGCGPDTAETSGSTDAMGAGMAGPVVDVQVTQEALDSRPEAPDLDTPAAAVRSFLGWTSYAYRIAQPSVAAPTMTSNWEVHVDSYIQYNIQKYRVIDQELTSITFGTPIVKNAKTTILPATETWSYRYVSAETPGKILEGPYTARYDTRYTLVKSDDGDWAVDEVHATALDTVK